jgi:hypothetical protein
MAVEEKEDYPEHEKLKKISGKSHQIGEFIDWLHETHHIVFCRKNVNPGSDQDWTASKSSTFEILASYFNIDARKLEEEKQEMLKHMRKMLSPGHKVGTRVGAVSHSEDDKVFMFGYGEYVGDKVPGEDGLPETPGGFMGEVNPCIKLDSGQYVWGCECWWGTEKSVKTKFGDREVVIVDIDERRAEVYAKQREESD